eukprot:GFUD01071198.1.p1 GENE.GFUD01071198.1~~GFUD01071198.1.p1  ORF type:complete len:330 (-),score=77.53 GFUD01071198.1:30-1019(-)
MHHAYDVLVNLVTKEQATGEISFTEYHRVEEIYMWLKNMEMANKDVMELIKIGTTHENRDILVAKLSVGQTNTNESRKAIFLEGGIHGREWISSAAVINLLQLILEKWDHRGCDIYLLPLANPDGYEFSHSSRRMWRKNRGRSPNILLNTFGLCKGTDLNRNFPTFWGEDVTNFTWFEGSRLSCAETYIGAHPGSEPETKAIIDFVTQHREELSAYVSIHSFGNVVVYPDNYSDKPDVQSEVEMMAKKLAESLEEGSGGEDRYESGPIGCVRYRAVGSVEDWARHAMGIKWVYLVELPSNEDGFFFPSEEIPRVGSSLLNFLKTLVPEM